jgi:hypothetical protein
MVLSPVYERRSAQRESLARPVLTRPSYASSHGPAVCEVGVFCSQPLLCTFSDLVTVVDIELTTLFAGLEEALVAP